ncbi:hypothetical protein BaRGS_00011872, partial [Batillaria attramentaria]
KRSECTNDTEKVQEMHLTTSPPGYEACTYRCLEALSGTGSDLSLRASGGRGAVPVTVDGTDIHSASPASPDPVPRRPIRWRLSLARRSQTFITDSGSQIRSDHG